MKNDCPPTYCFNNLKWCTISLRNNDKILVGVVYRSPNSNSENNNKTVNLIPNLSEFTDYSHCLILGDFNLPTINWATLSFTDGKQSLSVTFVNACISNSTCHKSY